MAIKPCKECGGPVSDKAESCPQCGAKQPKKTSVLAWIGLVLIILAGIGMCAEETTKSNSEQTQESKPIESNEIVKTEEPAQLVEQQKDKWEYNTTKDEMRGVETKFATIVSENTVNFDFPYDGGSKLILTLRKKGNETDVMVTISKGQILCRIDGCEAAFKFDKGAVQSITMAEPDNHASDVLFVMYDNTESKIINSLKNSKKLVIEVPFYQEGKKQFTFDVSGLNWSL